MIILSTILTLSIAINILLGWYMVRLLKRFLFLSDNLDDLFDQIDGYTMHIENVHSLETFYGEPVLQNLMNHSKDVVEYVDDFRNIFDDTKDTLELDEDEEIDDEQPAE
tara:strand:- start:2214 stop:2540 length:327 start_codon:yes stop_codon:yes gene_type:complete